MARLRLELGRDPLGDELGAGVAVERRRARSIVGERLARGRRRQSARASRSSDVGDVAVGQQPRSAPACTTARSRTSDAAHAQHGGQLLARCARRLLADHGLGDREPRRPGRARRRRASSCSAASRVRRGRSSQRQRRARRCRRRAAPAGGARRRRARSWSRVSSALHVVDRQPAEAQPHGARAHRAQQARRAPPTSARTSVAGGGSSSDFSSAFCASCAARRHRG